MNDLLGACPVVEQRCAHEELWALSALDMDGVGGEQAYEQAYELGRRLMMCCNVPGALSIKKAARKKAAFVILYGFCTALFPADTETTTP